MRRKDIFSLFQCCVIVLKRKEKERERETRREEHIV